MVAVGGAMVVIGVLAFVELRIFAGGHRQSSEAPEMVAAEAPRDPVATKLATLAAAANVSAPAAAPQAGSATSVAALSPGVDDGSEATARPTPPKPSARRRAPPTDANKASPPAVPSPAIVVEPSKVAAAPTRVAEVARNDPVQNFNVAFARCASEGLMARMGCEQRVRVQYCGDSWGQIPQCAIGRPIEHGQ